MALQIVANFDQEALIKEAKRLAKGYVEYEIEFGPETASFWLLAQGGMAFPDRELLNKEKALAAKRHGWS